MAHRRSALAALLVLALSGCANKPPPPPAELGTFPYHPLVYQLDLSILAYQLHGQTLVWPFDPFYEERATTLGMSRNAFMAMARDWAGRRGADQVSRDAGIESYRGPGALAGFEDNPSHDPIIYDYSRLHPWSDTIMNASGQWTEYLTPRAITGRIRDLYVCYRRIGSPATDLVLEQLQPRRVDSDANATDVLLAFEGGTGDKGEPGQPASQSLMGFVLVRDTGASGYDLHIAFRGSRSGSAARAAVLSLSTEEAAGNPDWITDLGWAKVDASSGAGDLTAVGAVSRGFATSMRSILPTLFRCLEQVAALRGASAPTHIFVTGHSLGGGLAQQFASAVLLGNAYGPGGAGPSMPPALIAWPWSHLKLVTFGAPRAGDQTWADALSLGALDSEPYDSSATSLADTHALLAIDPSIVARLHDPGRPAGFRVLISTDPITTAKVGGDGKHVGRTVYVNGDSLADWIGVPSFADHEPAAIRGMMLDAMADDRTPPIAWRYRELAELVPNRDASQKGTPAELRKLADALARYYADRALWFDEAAFGRDVDLMFAVEQGGG